jgi:hypothetical protein
MSFRAFPFFCFIVFVGSLVFQGANACSVCVPGGADDPATDAYNWSVFFLMAMPYAVGGSIAGWFAFNYRRAAASRRAKAPTLKLAWSRRREILRGENS